MLELYFFRDVSNYEELKKKTYNAYRIKSKIKRKVKIVKKIKLEEIKEFKKGSWINLVNPSEQEIKKV